ncbi:MAG: ribbon-helix-helix domain-containing protein [Thermodesulfobacteriota bacterium]
MKKDRVFSFKADDDLAKRLEEIPNRSAFVRRAVEAALEASCPLCHGSGVLPEKQHRHWRHFLDQHQREYCDKCEAVHFVCQSPVTDLH